MGVWLTREYSALAYLFPAWRAISTLLRGLMITLRHHAETMPGGLITGAASTPPCNPRAYRICRTRGNCHYRQGLIDHSSTAGTTASWPAEPHDASATVAIETTLMHRQQTHILIIIQQPNQMALFALRTRRPAPGFCTSTARVATLYIQTSQPCLPMQETLPGSGMLACSSMANGSLPSLHLKKTHAAILGLTPELLIDPVHFYTIIFVAACYS